jgi:hypothetical protein
MKHYNDGSVGFCHNRVILWFGFIASAVIVGAILYYDALNIDKYNGVMMTAAAFGFFSVYGLSCAWNLFIDKRPLVKFTHSCVEIKGLPAIHYEDIRLMYVEERRFGKNRTKRQYLIIKVKDLSFYKLKLSHKLRKIVGSDAFEKDVTSLTRADKDLLDKEIKEFFKKDIQKILGDRDKKR